MVSPNDRDSRKNFLIGILLATVSAVAYGLNPLFAMQLYDLGLNASEVLFYRYLIAAILLALFAAFRRENLMLDRKTFFPTLCAGMIAGLSSLFLFMSYQKLDVGVAASILFVYPVMTAVIMGCMFHERIKILTIISMLISVLGVVCLSSGKGSGGKFSALGLFYILSSALTYAIYLVMIKQTKARYLSGEKLSFYTMLFAVPVFLFGSHPVDALLHLNNTQGIVNILGLAIVPTILALWTVVVAIQKVGPTITSIFGALEPGTSVVVGVLVFSEAFTLNLMIGLLLVMGAVMLLIFADAIESFFFRLTKRNHE